MQEGVKKPMKAYIRKFSKIKKHKFAKKLVGLGCLRWSLKFGDMNPNPDHYLLTLVNSRQETQSLLETNNQNIENNCTRVKTGSGTVIKIRTLVQSSEALKSALETRCGDLGKSGPGARAKADARKNSKAKGLGRTIISGVNGFLPQNPYCQYHKSDSPLSCKSSVKVSNSPFQGDGNNSPPEDGQFDMSQYKGGPNPFIDKFDYDNPNNTRENVGCSSQKPMNHTYDRHAKKCFDIQDNLHISSFPITQVRLDML
jgi:hypothetical protein